MKTASISALFIALGACFSLNVSAAASDPLVGTWKTIDDRTGYSLADVIIQKNKDQYTATIISTRSVPGAEPLTVCSKCSGSQKNMPVVGMTTLSGLSVSPDNAQEFIGGSLLDPKSGQRYNARARLMSNGRHLIIHSSADGAAVGRNMTWVKN